MNDKLTKDMNHWRTKVVSCALEYTNHPWTPSIANSFHDHDSDGIFVNTPDTDYISTKYNCGWWQIDQLNKGIPYNWGGGSTIKAFDKGILEGKFAGNVPASRDNGISKYCVGVDCSGLVTICWDVGNKLSTRTIPNIATPLESMDLLLPGDVILLPGSHVMIFIEFTDETKAEANIVDATRNTGKVSLRPVTISELTLQGYKGFRKII